MNYIFRKKGHGRDSVAAVINQMVTEDIRILRDDRKPACKVETVIRWGTTVPLHSEVTINPIEGIRLASHKAAFRKVLNDHKLCPETWFNGRDIKYPAVIRPQRHQLGACVLLAKTDLDLDKAIAECGPGWYAAKYIKKVQEFRVFVVSGRAAWVAEKIPEDKNAVAWNNSVAGALFRNVKWDDWPLPVVRVAIEATKLSGLDFGAVDVIVDKADKPYVLEINTSAGLESEYRSGCIAKCFDYILDKGAKVIPLIEARGGFKKFIHPAIYDKALIKE